MRKIIQESVFFFFKQDSYCRGSLRYQIEFFKSFPVNLLCFSLQFPALHLCCRWADAAGHCCAVKAEHQKCSHLLIQFPFHAVIGLMWMIVFAFTALPLRSMACDTIRSDEAAVSYAIMSPPPPPGQRRSWVCGKTELCRCCRRQGPLHLWQHGWRQIPHTQPHPVWRQDGLLHLQVPQLLHGGGVGRLWPPPQVDRSGYRRPAGGSGQSEPENAAAAEGDHPVPTVRNPSGDTKTSHC